jgi:hypothetical protein
MEDFDDEFTAQSHREFQENFDRESQKHNQQFWRLFGAILGGIGSIFAIVGVGMGVHTHAYLSKMVATQGTVIDNNLYRSTDMDDRPTNYYYPVVKFTPKSSNKLTIFVGSTGSSPPIYRKGQQVKVLYDPQYPDAAKIESWLELWLFPTIFAGIGLPITAIGGAALIKSLKK